VGWGGARALFMSARAVGLLDYFYIDDYNSFQVCKIIFEWPFRFCP